MHSQRRSSLRKLSVQKRIYTTWAGEREEPVWLPVGNRKLEREERAAKAFQMDPFGKVAQLDHFGIERESKALGGFSPGSNGSSELLCKLPMPWTIGRGDCFRIARDHGFGFGLSGGTHPEHA